MKIGIVGARGFLGTHLAESLISEGHEVTGFVLNSPIHPTNSLNYLPVSSLESVEDPNDLGFDILINLAARRSTRANPLSDSEVREYTYSIPKMVILKSAGVNTTVLNASTYIQNFNGIEGRTVDSYGAAKQELSEFLRDYSRKETFRTLDLFLFTIFGSGDKSNHLVPSLLAAARSRSKISLSPGHQLMNLMYVDDVVENFSNALRLESDSSYQKYFLWQPEYFSVRELVLKMENVTGIKIDCAWGEREYAGHEMLDPWEIPMAQLPGFVERIGLEEGLRRLWTQT